MTELKTPRPRHSYSAVRVQLNDSNETPNKGVVTSSAAGLPSKSTEELAKCDNTADRIDALQSKLGGYGRYQILIYFLLGLVYMRGCWHAFISVFQGAVPSSYHCAPTPGIEPNHSVPEANVTLSECSQYINYSINNKTEHCTHGWVYQWDDNSPSSSIVSEFNLVCGDDYLNELSTTMYMVGATCGVVFLAPLAERYGAKSVMLICLWLQIIVGVAVAWPGYIAIFMVLKVFIGLFNMTIALCSFVLISETFDAFHRELPTLGMQFFWASGILILSLLGYLIRDWKYLQVVITVPINTLSIFYIWIVPSSIPWLLSKGKVKQADKVVKKFLWFNRLPPIPNLQLYLTGSQSDKSTVLNNDQAASIDGSQNLHSNDTLVQEDSTGKDTKQYTAFDLFKTPKLRAMALIMFYLFLVNALSYFGIVLGTPQLDGNPYLNLCLMGLVEIPADIVCVVAHKKIGRRKSIAAFLFICAISNIIVIFIPEETSDGTSLSALKITLVMIGKFGITGSYGAIYLYAAEIFPTVIRNQAVGACSFFENIGSIAAPNMTYVNKSMTNLPLAIFGGMTIVGSGLVLLLPETHNRPMPQTIADVEGEEYKGKD